MSYTYVIAPHFSSNRARGTQQLLYYTIQEADGRKYKIVRDVGKIHGTAACNFEPYLARSQADSSECRERGLDMPSSYGDKRTSDHKKRYDWRPLISKTEIIPPPSPHLMEIQRLQTEMSSLASKLSSSDATNGQLIAQNEELRQQIAVIQEQMARILSAIGH